MYSAISLGFQLIKRISIIFFLFNNFSYGDEICFRFYSQNPVKKNSVEEYNQQPAQLNFLYPKTYDFFTRFEHAFKQQKLKDPSRPYAIPVPELAHSVDFLAKAVGQRLEEVKQRPISDQTFSNQHLKNMYIEYLNLLLFKIQQLDSTAPLYDDLLKISYFAMRALSLTTAKELSRTYVHPLVRFTTGVFELSVSSKLSTIHREFNNLLDFDPFKEKQGRLIKNRVVFFDENKIFNPKKLEMIFLPIPGSVSPEIFNKLRGSGVYPVGLMKGKFEGDGFVFNETLLFNHDLYFHPGIQELGTKKFFKKNQINAHDQIEFKKAQEDWFDKMNSKLKLETDPKLIAAVHDIIITLCHDRGNVFTPDLFINYKNNNSKYRNSIIVGRIYLKAQGQLGTLSISDNFRENIDYQEKGLAWLARFFNSSEITSDPFYLKFRNATRSE